VHLENIDSKTTGRVALENIDSKDAGRVARELVLKLAAQGLGKIGDIQDAQSSAGIVAVAALVKPVVAICNGAQRSIRAGVGLAALN
jgi:hypothetical protein